MYLVQIAGPSVITLQSVM